MQNNTRFKFNFLKIFFCVAILLASVSIAIVQNHKTNNSSSVVSVSTSTNTAFTMNWTKDTLSTNEQPLNTTANSFNNTAQYSFDSTSAPSTIYGGTTITPSATTIDNKGNYTAGIITFTHSSKPGGSVTIMMNSGYAFAGIVFSDGGSNSTTWTVGNTNFSITPEEIDPTYTGALTFQVLYYEITYTMDMWYEDLDNAGNFQKVTASDLGDANYKFTYTISSPLAFNKDLNKSYGKTSFGAWMLNITELKELYSSLIVELNESSKTLTIAYTNSNTEKSFENFNLTFNYSKRITNFSAGDEIYYVTSVKGWGELKRNSASKKYVIDTRTISGFTINEDVANNKLTINRTGGGASLVCYYVAKESYLSNNYTEYYFDFNITMKGYTTLQTVYASSPVLRAKWSYTYNLTLDNSDTYWTNDNIKPEVEDDVDLLSGAISSVDTENESTNKATFPIKDNNNYAYKFMTSELDDGTGLSFFKQSDYTASSKYTISAPNGFYYVFNYGHRITGYQISFKTTESNYYLTFNNTVWDYSTAKSEILIEKLTTIGADGSDMTSMARFAELTDDYIAATGSSITSITMVPKWEAVRIGVIFNRSQNSSMTKYVSYGDENYNLNYNNFIIPPEGQSLIAFETTGESVKGATSDTIAVNGTWNYRNLTKDQYKFDKTANNLYKLYIKPIFVDNIYRVELTGNIKKYIQGIDDHSQDAYELIKTDYVFSENTINGVGLEKKEYTFSNYPTDGVEKEFVFSEQATACIDGYIPTLNNLIAQYNEGVAGSFKILRKVFYTGKGWTINGNQLQASSDIDSLEPELYIYLANNQETGRLPIFKTDYETIILWQNADTCAESNYNGYYVYRTADFDSNPDSGHYAEIEKNSFLEHSAEDGKLNKWLLADGYKNGTTNVVQWKPHYFRKNYDLQVSTILSDTGELDRVGYVNITVNDNLYKNNKATEDRSGKYLVIYDEINKKMQAYKTSSLADVLDGNAEPVDKISLYAGCELYIFAMDQSRSYDIQTRDHSLVGYKYSGMQSTNNPILDETTTDYDTIVNPADIESKGYNSGTIISLEVYFEKIVYTVDVKIDNAVAGSLYIEYKTGEITSVATSTKIKDMKVEENAYYINYYALAGFELQEEGFILKDDYGIVEPLADNSSQIYKLQSETLKLFDGEWLAQNFYGIFVPRSNINTTHLGTIIIQTQAIEFNYGVKIHDSTVSTNNGIIHTASVGTFALDSVTGEKALRPQDKDSFLADIATVGAENKGYYYEISDGAYAGDYAIKNSRLYYPYQPLTKVANYYQEYEFLLKQLPENELLLSSFQISNMVGVGFNGDIIPVNSRNIYILLDVSKIYTITLKVEEQPNDTNTTNKSTTLTNGDNNSVTLETLANKGAEAYAETVEIYTYYGLENVLTSNCNPFRYKAVEYYVESSKLSGNRFTAEGNTNVTIKYIPTSLQIDLIYQIDGVTTSVTNMSSYIDMKNLPNTTRGYYVGNGFDFRYLTLNPDYEIITTINTLLPSGEENSQFKQQITDIDPALRKYDVTNEYVVKDSDFDFGKITVVINAQMLDNSKINVKFQMYDTNKSLPADDYGTFSIYETNLDHVVTKADHVKELMATIITDRMVTIELHLNTGYTYVGLKHNSLSVVTGNITDNIIVLSTTYDPEVDYGTYVIFVDKVAVNATLDTTGLDGQYSISSGNSSVSYSNSVYTLHNIYIGKEIVFADKEVNTERLGYYYYEIGADKVLLTSDGTETGEPLKTFVVTGDVLNAIGGTTINFKVSPIKKYKMDYIINNHTNIAENGKSVEYKASGESYISGTYCDEGTEVVITVIPRVVGKFNVRFDGNDYDELNTVVTLDKDYNFIITVLPKTYKVEVTENLYSTLQQVKDGKPTAVAENEQVNAMAKAGQTYEAKAKLTFVRETEDRELSAVYFSGNDFEHEYVIEFSGHSYKVGKIVEGVVTYDETITLASLGLTITFDDANNKMVLGYQTMADVSLRLDYKVYKVISTN